MAYCLQQHAVLAEAVTEKQSAGPGGGAQTGGGLQCCPEANIPVASVFLKLLNNIYLVTFSCFQSVVSRRSHFTVSPSDGQLELCTSHQTHWTVCH